MEKKIGKKPESSKVGKTRVTMGVKGTRFRIVDQRTDDIIYKSKAYSTNSNATRGGNRYCKRMGLVIVESI